MKILVVDDDNFTLKLLSGIISQMGHTAIMARNGQEALARLDQGDIHLAITDWDMPGMDGLELCRAIRREDFPGYVYVIMFTAREGNDSHLLGLDAGADDFLSKPVRASQLLVRFKTAERILALETRDGASC